MNNEQPKTDHGLIVFILVVIIGVCVLASRKQAQPIIVPVQPAPVCPGPDCPRHPHNPHKPWGINEQAPVGASVGGTHAPNGQEIDIDSPPSQQLHNKGGSDGAGLCVFTAVNNAANWQHVQILRDLRDWMTKYPGGGYPAKLDKVIKRKCEEAGVPVPNYIQVEGEDLAILTEACKAGRMPCVTYSQSPTGRYNGQRIAHMVNIVNAGDWWAVLDNNYPCTSSKPNNYEWLTTAEFKRVHNMGGAWSVILLDPGAPPLPRN